MLKPSDKYIHTVKDYLTKYGFAVGITLLTVFIHDLLPFDRQTPYLLAPVPIIWSAVLGGVGPGVVAVVIKGLMIIYKFVPPYNKLKYDFYTLEQLLIFLLVGFFVVWLIESQRKTREEAVRQKKSQDLLIKASKVLFSSLDYKATLNNIAYMLVPQVADWCTVDLVNKNGKLERVVLAHADPKKIEWAKSIQKRYEYNRETTAEINEVINSKKSKLYQQVTNGMLSKSIKNKEYLRIVQEMGISSLMLVPLVASKKIVGVISLISSRANKHYDNLDLRFAEELGRKIGQAVENSRLYSTAKEEIEVRKAAEKKLEEAKEQLEVILENITDGITVQDKSGKLVFVNDAAARFAGFSSKQSMLETFSSAKHADKSLGHYEMRNQEGNPVSLDELPNRKVWQGEKKPEAVIQYLDKSSGQTRWSLTRARPVLDDENKIQYAVTIITDISREKEIDRKKDEFISIASHELKTPLTSIKAYTQLLNMKLATVLNKKYSSYLVRMENQIDRLVNLVSELLDVTKIQSGKLALNLETFDFRVLLNDIVGTMQLTTANHKFEVIGSKKLFIKADRSRLEQVLSNLLVNAIKYSPEGGSITLSFSSEGKDLLVHVKDSGLGIAKDEQATIFDRFNQTQAKKKEGLSGLGLGLYISSEIVKRHSGKIWVSSESGKGSTFSFSMPVVVKHA